LHVTQKKGRETGPSEPMKIKVEISEKKRVAVKTGDSVVLNGENFFIIMKNFFHREHALREPYMPYEPPQYALIRPNYTLLDYWHKNIEDLWASSSCPKILHENISYDLTPGCNTFEIQGTETKQIEITSGTKFYIPKQSSEMQGPNDLYRSRMVIHDLVDNGIRYGVIDPENGMILMKCEYSSIKIMLRNYGQRVFVLFEGNFYPIFPQL
jgi:hypothetical protein